jgi:hypothetical protein
MIKAFTMAGASLLVGVVLGAAAYAQAPAPKPGAAPMKMTQAECTSLWNRLDAAKSGNVSEAQAGPYVTDFKAVDANKDGKLTQAEFQAGCDKGQVHGTATTGPGNGTPGSTIPKK